MIFCIPLSFSSKYSIYSILLIFFTLFAVTCWLLKILDCTVRHICIARNMPWQDVCPTVCHTMVLCLNGYTYPQRFLPSGSPTILVFPYQTGWQYSNGNPLTGASNARGYEKITIFDQYWALSWNWCDKKSGVNTTKNVNDYYNVRSEICLFVLELFNCLCSEVRKCK